MKVNPGAHIQLMQNGVTLRHPSLPPHPASAPQPLPPAIIASPSTIAPPLPSVSPYDFAQQLVSIGSPRPPTQLIAGNPVNGYSFIDRRYRQADRRSAKSSAQPRQLTLSDEGSDLVQRIVENMELKKLAKRSANHTEVPDKVSGRLERF